MNAMTVTPAVTSVAPAAAPGRAVRPADVSAGEASAQAMAAAAAWCRACPTGDLLLQAALAGGDPDVMTDVWAMAGQILAGEQVTEETLSYAGVQRAVRMAAATVRRGRRQALRAQVLIGLAGDDVVGSHADHSSAQVSYGDPSGQYRYSDLDRVGLALEDALGDAQAAGAVWARETAYLAALTDLVTSRRDLYARIVERAAVWGISADRVKARYAGRLLMRVTYVPDAADKRAARATGDAARDAVAGMPRASVARLAQEGLPQVQSWHDAFTGTYTGSPASRVTDERAYAAAAAPLSHVAPVYPVHPIVDEMTVTVSVMDEETREWMLDRADAGRDVARRRAIWGR